MKADLKIQELHKRNLKYLGKLAFISDGLIIIKKMFVSIASKSGRADKEVVQDCSELDHKITRLKKNMIKHDSNLLSFLCTGKLIPEDKLKENERSIKELSEVNNKYIQLRTRIARMLKRK